MVKLIVSTKETCFIYEIKVVLKGKKSGFIAHVVMCYGIWDMSRKS